MKNLEITAKDLEVLKTDYPSLKDNTFSEACFNQNSIKELINPGDLKNSCNDWNITELEAIKEMKLAVIALYADVASKWLEHEDHEDWAPVYNSNGYINGDYFNDTSYWAKDIGGDSDLLEIAIVNVFELQG